MRTKATTAVQFKIADKALLLNPSFADAIRHARFGTLPITEITTVTAIQDYDQAIRLNPNSAEAFYNPGAGEDLHKGNNDRCD